MHNQDRGKQIIKHDTVDIAHPRSYAGNAEDLNGSLNQLIIHFIITINDWMVLLS